MLYTRVVVVVVVVERRRGRRQHPPSFLTQLIPVFVFRGEQIKRLLYTPLQTGVSTSRFSVRLVNPSRIVFGPLDEVVRVVGVFLHLV